MQTTDKMSTSVIKPTGASTRPRWVRRLLEIAPLYIVLVPLTIITLVPIVYMFSLAFTPEADVLRWPIRYIPENPTLINFQRLMSNPDLPILRWLFNSFFVSTTVTLLVLFTNSLTAYAFARLEFPGREVIFLIILTTMMIPGQVTMIPTFLIMRELRWLDTYHALVWPAGAGVFGVFLLRQFFQSIPTELEDAAIIDGCSKLRIYWSVIMPLSRSALAALAIFTFLGSWNDLFWPLIVLNSSEMRTLPVGLTILNSEAYTQRGLTMAGAALTSTPVLVLYTIFQRRIIEGVMVSGLTGR